jgi:hypothetical protein
MKKIISFLLISSILFSSCASILNGRYQKVAIKKKENATVLINGEKPVMKQGKYVLRRDGIPKEVTIRKEGYKDNHYTLIQGNRSPWYILSCIPFGILLYPALFDRGPKAGNFEKEYDFRTPMHELPYKSESLKNIRLNKVLVNLDSTSVKSRYFSRYRTFKKRRDKGRLTSDLDRSIKVENTPFMEHLNSLLVKQGFIDTTNRVLTDNYSNDLFLNATVKGVSIHAVDSKYGFGESGDFGNFGYIDLEIEWELLDYYKESIYQFTSISTSGQFKGSFLKESIYDALEVGLLEFLSKDSVRDELLKQDDLSEEEMGELVIVNPKRFVEDISDVAQASVTIKNKKGHGSGFIISNDGYIVTNYHVVSKKEDLQVILNNEEKYKVEVIRVNKMYDLALLKIEKNDLIPFKLGSKKDIKLATEIYAVGTPSAEDLGQTISRGIISGIRSTDFGNEFIQTDASINSGNSGGAIVNRQGVVLGVVSSKLVGLGIEGVAFGIPCYDILDQLKIKFE